MKLTQRQLRKIVESAVTPFAGNNDDLDEISFANRRATRGGAEEDAEQDVVRMEDNLKRALKEIVSELGEEAAWQVIDSVLPERREF